MKKIILTLTFLVITNSCNYRCENTNLIKIKTILNKNYCELINESLNKDELSFNTLLRLKVNDKDIYNHGEVLLQIIDLNGEKFTIMCIDNFDKLQKFRLRIYLGAGLQKTNLNKFEGKSFDNVFPELNTKLNTQTRLDNNQDRLNL